MTIQSDKKIKEFVISTIERKNSYKIEILQNIALLGEHSGNETTLFVDKRFISKDEHGYLFEIIVNERIQSDLEAFRGLEFEFSKLQSKILIYTNDLGAPIRIANIKALREEWVDIKMDIRKQYQGFHNLAIILSNMDTLINSEDGYLKLFKNSEIGTLLFPSIYYPELQERQLLKHKFFLNFFGDIPLPLRTKTEFLSFEEESAITKVCKSGSLAVNILDLDGVRKYFKSLYNKHVFIESIDINYAELYDLDAIMEVENAVQIFYLTLADNVYTFDQKVLISKT